MTVELVSDYWLCWFQVQQLKSVNNLWSDWQLGVREFILVPVSEADERNPQSSADCLTLNNGAATGVTTSCELVTRQELSVGSKLPKSASVGRQIADGTSQPVSSVKQKGSESVEDYFSKYDLSLEKIKENVHRMEQTMKSVFFYWIKLFSVIKLIIIVIKLAFIISLYIDWVCGWIFPCDRKMVDLILGNPSSWIVEYFIFLLL